MWYSESHPSQKPTLISYDELKKKNPLSSGRRRGNSQGEEAKGSGISSTLFPQTGATTDATIRSLLCLWLVGVW